MRGSPTVLTDFSGGLNLRDDPWDLGLNESPDVWNLRPAGDKGAAIQREGDISQVDYSAVANTGDPQKMLDGLAQEGLVTATSRGFMVWSGVGAPTVIEATHAVGLGETVAIVAPETGGQGPLYYITPAQIAPFRRPRYYKSPGPAGDWTAASGTLPATAQFLLYAGNRVWAAATLADGDLVQWSEVGDPRTWPAANINRFGVGDGEQITGIAQVGKLILVFKPNKLWRIYDLDTGANEPIANEGGTPLLGTPHGLVVHNATYGDLRLTLGGVPEPFSQRLGPLGSVEDAAYVGKSLFVILTPRDGDRGIYEHRFDTGAWWRHRSSVTYDTLAAWKFSNSDVALYAGSTGKRLDALMGPSSVFVSSYVDRDDLTLAPRWTTPYLALGDVHKNKRLRSVQVAGKGTMTLTVNKDDDGTVLGTDGPFTVPSTHRHQTPGLGVARAAQLVLDGSGILEADAMTLEELAIYATVRND